MPKIQSVGNTLLWDTVFNWVAGFWMPRMIADLCECLSGVSPSTHRSRQLAHCRGNGRLPDLSAVCTGPDEGTAWHSCLVWERKWVMWFELAKSHDFHFKKGSFILELKPVEMSEPGPFHVDKNNEINFQQKTRERTKEMAADVMSC